MILSLEGTDGSGKSYLAEYLVKEHGFENIRGYYKNFNIDFNYEESTDINHVALFFYLFDKNKSDVIEKKSNEKIIVEKYGFTNNAMFTSMKANFKQFHYNPKKPKMPKELFSENITEIKCQDAFNKAVNDKKSPINTFNICDTARNKYKKPQHNHPLPYSTSQKRCNYYY